MTGTGRRTACSWLLLAGVVAAAGTAAAERQPYDRYQSIVDRQMFGPLPPNFDPTKSPAEVSKSSGAAAEKELTKEQEKVKSAIRFSVINVTPEGDTAIGFTDNSDPKAPKHYYLKVGEARGGWEVKAADAKAATMTIAKDGVEVSLTLGGDSSKDGANSASGGRDSAIAQPRRSTLLTTLGGRRRARRELEEAEEREVAKRAAERAAEQKAREEERARREEEERAQRAAEREESRRQLMQIQEELRKQREEQRQKQESEQKSDSETESGDNQ